MLHAGHLRGWTYAEAPLQSNGASEPPSRSPAPTGTTSPMDSSGAADLSRLILPLGRGRSPVPGFRCAACMPGGVACPQTPPHSCSAGDAGCHKEGRVAAWGTTTATIMSRETVRPNRSTAGGERADHPFPFRTMGVTIRRGAITESMNFVGFWRTQPSLRTAIGSSLCAGGHFLCVVGHVPARRGNVQF